MSFQLVSDIVGWVAFIYLAGKALLSLWFDRDRPGRKGWE